MNHMLLIRVILIPVFHLRWVNLRLTRELTGNYQVIEIYGIEAFLTFWICVVSQEGMNIGILFNF